MIETAARYRKFNDFLRTVFGEKVYRVGLYGGFTCPNRDGTLGREGCAFCNPASSEPLGYTPGMPLDEQLARGTAYIRERHGAAKFIAYFQDYTATYGDSARLEALCRRSLAVPGVVGLALGTRPDCLPDEVLDLLARLARETFMWVELGVQTVNDETLAMIGRGHDVATSRRAIAALHARGVPVAAHVLLGLPGEGDDDHAATARFLNQTGVAAVKLHNLHIVRDTPMASMHARGEVEPPTLPGYVDAVTAMLERLSPATVVMRLAGDAPRRLTVAPAWSVNKLAVINAIERALRERSTWQGRGTGTDREDLDTPVRWPLSGGDA